MEPEVTMIESGLVLLGTIVFYVYWVIALFVILMDEDRESTSVVSWLLIIFIFPIFGFVLYLLFGYNHRHKKMIETKQPPESKTVMTYNNLVERFQKKASSLKTVPDEASLKLATLVKSSCDSIVTTHNTLKILNSGQEKFDYLLKDLRKAKSFIHMDYFIWRDDKLTKEVKDILIERATDGVEVRIIMDSLGALRLRRKYIKELKTHGIKVHLFYNIFSPSKILFFNHRSHRKIVVIDGIIGYTGGMNMGQEYIDGKPMYTSWRDTHLRLTGESVLLLQKIFIENWYDMSRENLYHTRYFPYATENLPEQELPIQIVHSGPDSTWPSIQKMYFSMINSATKYVYIQSPYFVPDKSIISAISTAALSGIDVRIIVTGVPDKKIPYWTAFTYFRDILQAGGKIYHYNAGFMHSKSIVIDDKIGSIGTTNMDIRSFKLNYEVNTLFYDEHKTHEMKNIFKADLKNCTEFTLKDYENISRLKQVRNSMARLASPLL
ncbi:MAG: cardiolipin synthase [Candidatus Moraniibacteriota bacterium]|jgi:cardiolipin synthase A/B